MATMPRSRQNGVAGRMRPCQQREDRPLPRCEAPVEGLRALAGVSPGAAERGHERRPDARDERHLPPLRSRPLPRGAIAHPRADSSGAAPDTAASACAEAAGLAKAPLRPGHQVDHLDGVGARRARLGALEHDRAERAAHHDGVRAGRLQLLEPRLADARAGLVLLEQQAAAGAAAERVVLRPLRLGDIASVALEQRARRLVFAGVASEVARVVKRDGFVFEAHRLLVTRDLLDQHRRVHDLALEAELPGSRARASSGSAGTT